MRRRLRIIINPVAGTGRQRKAARLLDARLDRDRFDADVVYTEYQRHAHELAKEAVNLGYDAVVIVGGDGSINEVGSALAGTDVALGIIPAGSGNGLAGSLGVPLNLTKAVDNINSYLLRTIDTGTANGIPFMNVAGAGFDAYVANKFHKAKMRGLWKYLLVGLSSLGEYRPQKYVFEADGRRFERTANVISVANSPQYGNNALIAPKAKVDDGMLDLVICNDTTMLNSIGLIIRLFLHNIDQSPLVKTMQCRELTITQERNDTSHLDGDPFELGQIIRYAVKPLSLKVIVPNGQEYAQRA
ncbi:MAG: diacylglycerol kinase family lipid kinase [Flavobacteriales bacterium]|nr:diacylglycerol kinase family lipid kinase [Flavobacteriales bacterium]